jgi:hypothetical protein
MSEHNLLSLLADVVEVLKAGTNDPNDLEQIAQDDQDFFNAARLFIAEVRREAEKRGQGDWTTISLIAAFEYSLAQDQDLAAACQVIREWLTFEQAAAASMN